VLTKFDTIDDKVGSAISMTYISGQPIGKASTINNSQKFAFFRGFFSLKDTGTVPSYSGYLSSGQCCWSDVDPFFVEFSYGVRTGLETMYSASFLL
jgi:hypothetical protein